MSALSIPPWGWQQCLGTHFTAGPEPSRMWRSVLSCVCACVCVHACVCISASMCFCFFFFPPFSDVVYWLNFLPLEEFGKALRFFLLHDFQQCSLSLSYSLFFCCSLTPSHPCLLWLCTNRFHMLLQLTSVLNYFTCDPRYFLRKSVRYLLKANKNKPPLLSFYLSFACSFFISLFLFLAPVLFRVLSCPQKLA